MKAKRTTSVETRKKISAAMKRAYARKRQEPRIKTWSEIINRILRSFVK